VLVAPDGGVISGANVTEAGFTKCVAGGSALLAAASPSARATEETTHNAISTRTTVPTANPSLNRSYTVRVT
jgi:hypothetical protein